MRGWMMAAGALALGGTAGGAAWAARDTPEVAYDKLLADKVAGKPQACLDTRRQQSSLSAYGDKLIYTVGRKLVYVNQTTGGCERVARGDTLVTRSPLSQSCRGDIARTVNLVAGIDTGSCALGDFTPYRAR